MRHVVILGAGIIGLGVAVELIWRGAQVTLIDPRTPGSAASSGNTGWVVPALSAPVPAPGLPLQVARWMLQRDSPFRIDVSSVPGNYRWLSQFWNHCNPVAHRQGLLAQGRLNVESYDGYRRWQAAGLSFEHDQPGVTFVAEQAEHIEHIIDELNVLAPWGYLSANRMNASELRAAFPAMSSTVQGGVHAPGEQFVRPESVISALVDTIIPHGMIHRSAADSVESRGSRVTGVRAGNVVIDADAAVIATGAWMAETGRLFGLDLPIVAGKGYSITVQDPEISLGGPLYLADEKIACTPFQCANRFAGMMELTGTDESMDATRIASMTAALDRRLPGWSRGSKRSMWAGLRPMTPDGLPLIGKIPELENVYVAGGHGMLGVTMAPVTGEIIAELIMDGETRHDLTAFRPDRFQVLDQIMQTRLPGRDRRAGLTN